MKTKSQIGRSIRFLWQFVRKEGWLSAAIVSLILVIRLVDVTISVQYKNFIDVLTGAGANPDNLLPVIYIILGLNLTVWTGWRLVEYMNNYWQPRIMQQLYNAGFAYLHKHSYTFFINNFAGSLVKRLNRLPSGFENISDVILFNLYSTFIQIFASLFVIYTVKPILAGLLALWLFVFIYANYRFSLFKMKYDNEVNVLDSKLSGLLADTVSNHFNISLFGTMKYERRNFEQMTETWRRTNTKSWNWGSVGNAVQALMMVLIEFLMFYIGIGLWREGTITVGDFVLLQTLLFGIFLQIWDFGRNLRRLSRGFSDAEEMIEVMHTPLEIVDKPGAKPLKTTEGKIEVKNLTFGYLKDTPVFNNFSLEIQAGRKIALVSRSGEGKSTLTKLLMRMYNVPENTIFIDGQDIMQVQQESLRRSISFVPQDPVLFHRSLADNIAYGKQSATMDEIIEASKRAHCHEFISKLPDGYNTFVGERGVKLSGGERQRVAIARAILENAKILILDEATSALDSESEHLIQEGLKELMKQKTSIVIAHRLSTINQMDEIIVIEKGSITERGTHAQLLEKPKGHYRMLWDIQAGGFEE